MCVDGPVSMSKAGKIGRSSVGIEGGLLPKFVALQSFGKGKGLYVTTGNPNMLS